MTQSFPSTPRRRRWTAAVLGLVVGAATLLSTTLTAPSASAAASSVEASDASTVTADALPTVQINGVVWSQAVVGKTVFAGGSFSQARPAGAAAGTSQTARSNLLSYDISTGNLNAAFAPTLNGQVLAVAKSPDGSRIYVGGDFTSVNGSTRSRIAAFSTSTGQLITSFAPPVGYQVRAIVATDSTVYVGGAFAGVGSQARGNLAAFNASNGALLAWSPMANLRVSALALSSDGKYVLAGGSFETVNGSASRGLAKIDAVTGALQPWPVAISNAGADSGITSLSVEGDVLYGTGFHFGPGGNLEGPWSVQVSTGALRYAADCHGDTYSNFVAADTVYTVGHSHYCGNVGGGFPQYSTWKFQHSMAWTKNATGTNQREVYGYANWEGQPSPSIKQWLPTMAQGSYTGQYQAGWSVAGNSDYVVVGGEFPRVNGTAQQGLVRFAVKPIATGKRGPTFQNNQLIPTLQAVADRKVKIGWLAGSDQDDASLSYEVVRSPGGVVKTLNASSTWWNMPALSYVDSGLTPGQTYSYSIRATDSSGNRVNGSSRTITVPASVTSNPYANRVVADGADVYWPMDDAAGTGQLADLAGGNTAVTGTGVTAGTAGAVSGNTAATIDGTDAGRSYSQGSASAPTEMTSQVWFKTSAAGGRLLGFSDLQTGDSGHRDRQLYLTSSGQVAFGVQAGGPKVVTSPKAYNDNQWHQAVATMSGKTAALYVDGVRVGSRTDIVDPEVYVGYWRLSGDSMSGWPAAGSANFSGVLDEVSIYPSALTAAQVDAQYVASGRESRVVQAPTDAYGKTVFADQPDLFWRLGEAAGPVAVDTGELGSNGTYVGGYTLGQQGAVTGTGNSSATFDGTSGFVSSDASYSNPTTFTTEAWFKTTSNRGGKIIGFGANRTGLSNNYDRHVYLQDDGRVVFGVWTGQSNTITSQKPFNDGTWHHMVASLSGDGMKLYLDGQLAGTDPQTGAENYTGYWKVGGDVTWGSSSPYLAGSIDEVAVYPRALSQSDVLKHYTSAGGELPNTAPSADFSASTDDLTASFDASNSTDQDGSVTSYGWDFGDGRTGSGKTADHTYAATGTYQVKLTVADDRGATAVAEKSITVTAPPPNQAPSAAFSADKSDLTVSVDAGDSSDTDGSVKSYVWDFGDGKSGTGETAEHTYSKAGTYSIQLTVTDDDDATDTITKDVTVTEPANVEPTAAFSVDKSDLTVSVDAGDSSDTDGSVKSYVWDFGDGKSGTGETAEHSYSKAGTYSIQLTVTDDDDATDTITKDVIVTAPPTEIATDGFGRTAATGWGDADRGGKWTQIGSASNFAVTGSKGTIKMTSAGSGPRTYLDSVSAADLDASLDFAFDKAATGSGTYLTAAARRVGNTEYRVKARALPTSVQLIITKAVDGTETTIKSTTVSGMTYNAGDVLRLRFTVSGTGTTDLKAKVWKTSAAEPTSWQVTGTDNTAALQRAGSFGVQAYLSTSATNAPIVATVDNVSIVPVG